MLTLMVSRYIQLPMDKLSQYAPELRTTRNESVDPVFHKKLDPERELTLSLRLSKSQIEVSFPKKVFTCPIQTCFSIVSTIVQIPENTMRLILYIPELVKEWVGDN